MATPEQTQVEIGFAGGGVVRCMLGASEAEGLEHAYRDGGARLLALDAESGPVVVDLARVVYVRALAPRSRVGFSEAL
jgi:hypothetical protein